jgi:hypothetical protein
MNKKKEDFIVEVTMWVGLVVVSLGIIKILFWII